MPNSERTFQSNPSTIVVPATGPAAIFIFLESGAQRASDIKSQVVLCQKGQSLAPAFPVNLLTPSSY